jgi:S1-C subfamily serine protease
MSADNAPVPLRLPFSATLLAVLLTVAFVGCSSSPKTKGAASTAATPTTVSTNAPAGADSGILATLEDAFVNVVAKVRPSVVEISTGTDLGSGIVYDDKGNIVTNAHVVGNATAFKVSFVDGRTLDGTLVGSYVPNDIAVVKVSNANGLTPAPFANSAAVKVGQISLAIGNPLGLESSVTEGVVSSTGRTVSEGGGVVLPSMIQTSAAINPGNSGGALVDLNGAVMGIPTLAAVSPDLGQAPGIGFAIPSNTVKLIADQLINTGKVTNSGRAALGIAGSTVVNRAGQPAGVLVRSADVGKPAAAAGIKPGDVITAINGKPTATLDDLQTVLAGLAPGQEATVDVTHADGSKQSYKVTLATL